MVLGELAEKEGDPHGEEDEEYCLDTKYIVWIIYLITNIFRSISHDFESLF